MKDIRFLVLFFLENVMDETILEGWKLWFWMAPYNVLIDLSLATYPILHITAGPFNLLEKSIDWDEYVLFILFYLYFFTKVLFLFWIFFPGLNRNDYVMTSDINYLPCIVDCFLECDLDFGHLQAEKKKRKAQLQEANRKEHGLKDWQSCSSLGKRRWLNIHSCSYILFYDSENS